MAAIALNALLWAAALAATVWILVPAIAFALRLGGIRTEILPDVGPPPVAGRDPVFGPRLAEFAALGFREVARTVTRIRFPFPTHWRWRSLETTRWLVSLDGRTYATLFRLVRTEPARVCCVTIFDDGSVFSTSCPGVSGTVPQLRKYRRFDVRGASAEDLVAEHQRQIERFARDNDVGARAATVAEVNAVVNAVEWPLIRKTAASSYGIVAAFLPALFFLVPFGRGLTSSRETALMVCLLAGCYAFVRWLIHGPFLRRNALRTHTEEISGQPNDVAEGRTILATGRYERWLRILAVPAAALASAWFVALLSRLPQIRRIYGAPGIVIEILFITVTGTLVLRCIERSRGKLEAIQMARRPEDVWSFLGFANLFFSTNLRWSEGALHRFLYLVTALSLLVAAVGWQLEKKRGK